MVTASFHADLSTNVMKVLNAICTNNTRCLEVTCFKRKRRNKDETGQTVMLTVKILQANNLLTARKTLNLQVETPSLRKKLKKNSMRPTQDFFKSNVLEIREAKLAMIKQVV